MLEMYMNSPVSVGVGSPITFTKRKEQTGCTAVGVAPASSIRLNRPGFYEVNFNAVVANNTLASGLVGVEMTRDGIVDESALARATSAGATDFVNLSFSTLVRVGRGCPCSCDNPGIELGFRITGVAALVSFANVVVTKLA